MPNERYASASGEDIMPSEHDKIDSKKVIGSLNTILELELAGVVRCGSGSWGGV